ncbi:MAG TPA: DUF6496 domain-containing protein [Bryobacteraceae bacterium]|nr:DUF6496 domain-containing protein [Bryobacteraceae bacterium]
MPEKKTKEKARKAKSPSTKASAYVHEEIEHVREGKHGARSAKQAIAIGLSKARRAGVKIPPPPGKKGTKTAAKSGKPNAKRSRATTNALKREGSAAASHTALSRQSRGSAKRRGSAARKQSAQKAVRTKGASGRKQAAAKAARTRARKAA